MSTSPKDYRINFELRTSNPNHWNPSTLWVMHVHEFFLKFRIHLVHDQVVNDEKLIYKTILKKTYKMFTVLTAWPYAKWIQNLKFFAYTCITHEVCDFQRFGSVVWNQSNSLLEVCSSTPLDEHITPQFCSLINIQNWFLTSFVLDFLYKVLSH